MTDDEWICWNYETGFSVIAAKDEDDAKLQCELNQPAVLLGEEKEIKENMWELLGEKKAIVIQARSQEQAMGWKRRIRVKFPLLPVELY